MILGLKLDLEMKNRICLLYLRRNSKDKDGWIIRLEKMFTQKQRIRSKAKIGLTCKVVIDVRNEMVSATS